MTHLVTKIAQYFVQDAFICSVGRHLEAASPVADSFWCPLCVCHLPRSLVDGQIDRAAQYMSETRS